MDENMCAELNVLKINFQVIMDEICEVHNLSSNLVLICKANSKSVKKNKIFIIAKSINQKINNALNFYYLTINSQTQPASIEDAFKTLKYAIENKMVILCDN